MFLSHLFKIAKEGWILKCRKSGFGVSEEILIWFPEEKFC